MRLFKYNSNRFIPSYQSKELWLINDSFDMFVNRGDGIISKLILEILSFYHPKDKNKCIAIYLQELIGAMYPKYKKNYAPRYKRLVKESLENEKNFEIEIKGKKKKLFNKINLYEDGLILITINETFMNHFMYIEDHPLKDKKGFFKIDVNKLNQFKTMNKYIPLWLYITQLTNNGTSLSKFNIWKTTLYPKLGIYNKVTYTDFNCKFFKPAMRYIIEIDKDKECKVDEIETRTVGNNQFIRLSIAVPKICVEKSAVEYQDPVKKELPDYIKSFLKSIK